jgi:hypothetical protein
MYIILFYFLGEKEFFSGTIPFISARSEGYSTLLSIQRSEFLDLIK